MFKMNKFYLMIFSVLIILRCINAVLDCRFEYQGDFPANPSVLVSSNNELLEPKYDPIRLNYNEPIFVLCPGSNNVIDKFNQQYVTARCHSGKSLLISNKIYQFSELGCRKKVESNCKMRTTICGYRRTGTIVDIGHEIGAYVYPIFQICYDYTKNVTLYAQQKIYGATIGYAKGSTSRPRFKEGCLPDSIKKSRLDRVYVVANQLERFANIFSSEQFAKRYIIDRRSYLAKGHLNADSDQVFNTSTTATYFYINTLPMWQQINNGNWKSLEITIRNVAKKNNLNLMIFTGGYDILKLEDSNGVEKEIYLDDDGKIAVPKYIWKIIYSQETQERIGFVVLNNPFYKGLTMDICENICDSNKWGTAAWKDPKGGLLYCCSFEELSHEIPQIPVL